LVPQVLPSFARPDSRGRLSPHERWLWRLSQHELRKVLRLALAFARASLRMTVIFWSRVCCRALLGRTAGGGCPHMSVGCCGWLNTRSFDSRSHSLALRSGWQISFGPAGAAELCSAGQPGAAVPTWAAQGPSTRARIGSRFAQDDR